METTKRKKHVKNNNRKWRNAMKVPQIVRSVVDKRNYFKKHHKQLRKFTKIRRDMKQLT